MGQPFVARFYISLKPKEGTKCGVLFLGIQPVHE